MLRLVGLAQGHKQGKPASKQKSGQGVRIRPSCAMQGVSREFASEGYLKTPHRWQGSPLPLWPGTLYEDYS